MTTDDDCVSRQEVLNLIIPLAGDEDGVNVFMKLLDDVENLDKVEPERPKGKWLTPYGSYSYRLTTYKCSLCEVETDNRSNYCPSCGAYMKVNRMKGELLTVAELTRPNGKWISTNPPGKSDNIVCTVCGYNSIADFNFCPNCGADMREVSECSEEKQD